MSLNSTITALGNSIINLVNKRAKVDLSNISSDGENVIKEISESTLNNRIHNSNALETGAVGNDKDVYKDIYKYVHSTFDRSKLTTVGNPEITSNGVLSTFSDISNYAVIQNINLYQKSFKVTAKVTIPDTWEIAHVTEESETFPDNMKFFTTTAENFENSGSILSLGVVNRGNGTISPRMVVYNPNDPDNHYSAGWSFPIYVNKVGTYIFSWDFNYQGKTIDVEIRDENCKILQTYHNNAPETWQIPDVNFNIRFDSSHSCYPSELDLKYFTLDINGLNKINFNKMGIDILKEDNYAVGSVTPVINDQRMLLSAPDFPFVCPPDGITIPSDYIFKLSFYRDTTAYYQGYSITKGMLQIYVNYANPRRIMFFCHDGQNTNHIGNLYLPEDTNKYTADITVKKEGDTFCINGDVHFNGRTASLSLTKTLQNYDAEIPNYLHILGPAIGGAFVNLNTVMLFDIHKNLLWQPCLRIPYTETVHNSKVSPRFWHSCIKQLYEENYYTPYYTIDETNQDYSLPMGELYGAMENIVNRKSEDITNCIIPDYENGVSITSGTFTCPANGIIISQDNITLQSTQTVILPNSMPALVNKNDVISTNGGMFYPMKGAN